MALNGSTNIPYDAADIYSSHMAEWRPYLPSADGELNVYRDRIVARMRDLVRNDGWASGAVTRLMDSAIGANFRPIFKPDYKALAYMSGNKAFDAEWADEYGRVVTARWRDYCADPGRYCDVSRRLNMTQMLRLAFRHKLIDGDALAIMHWRPERVIQGKARYATCVQIVDADRLSNPQLRFDQRTMRGGVEVDEDDQPVAYWIRRAHQGDWFSAVESLTWDRIDRETSWGRPIVVHDFDAERAGQHRGGIGIFGAVAQRLKMLIRYDSVELDAAILNAIFGAYIESPYDPALVREALGDDEELGHYQGMRADFHSERRLTLGGVAMPTLFPGEKIQAVAANRPNDNFAEFEAAILRNVTAATGLSAPEVTNNWSDLNYSSYRGAAMVAWKTLNRRRWDFAMNFAQPILCAWMEEDFDVNGVPLPRGGAPGFMDARAAYSRARWMGPGRGMLDVTKETEGSVMGMQAGLTTLEDECAEISGEDFEDILDQRAVEMRAFKERGLEPPGWMFSAEAIQARQASQTGGQTDE